MKKLIIVLLTLWLLCSCGSNTIEEITTIPEVTTTVVTTSTKSASAQLEEIKKQFEKENYKNVLRLIDKLQTDYPNSNEALEASELIDEAQRGLNRYTYKIAEVQTTTATTAYQWKLNTNSTGKDWNSVNDTEKEVWCSNSIASWRLMGYDIPSDVTISHMKSYMNTYYEDGKHDKDEIVVVSEVYAILMNIY